MDADGFSILAEQICSRIFQGRLPACAEAVCQNFLLSAPEVFADATEEAVQDFCSRLIDALKAHFASDHSKWPN